ncbi:hypothetical protein GUJ93_ZPchr0001g30120 [Zizania palustris]|uniref:Uncharacterized protein n=1 Tax=Zizania palustris TaxID=103762 RepID=A0A8J5R542_ZIZPA|nr:hypothetical protein GUJ93_ZPchr0001g30120 [Zizania palustris]
MWRKRQDAGAAAHEMQIGTAQPRLRANSRGVGRRARRWPPGVRESGRRRRGGGRRERGGEAVKGRRADRPRVGMRS